MTKVIDSFTGEYAFLSNFYEAPMVVGGRVVKTVEHAYQAAKANNQEEALAILALDTPAQTKKAGRKVNLRATWNDEKLQIMIALLIAKFTQHRDLAEKLVATGDAYLVEGNWWGDTHWGVCKGVGENWLGRILMTIRSLMIDMGIDAYIEEYGNV